MSASSPCWSGKRKGTLLQGTLLRKRIFVKGIERRMPTSVPVNESRSPERLREHYLIERELADRLRSAGRDERRHLYTALYDELFRRVRDHPQLTRKADARTQAASVAGRMSLLRRFLSPDTVYLEVGPGDCAL